MNPSTVIGREEELATISRLYESDRSEFLAVYGRRRIGKSFLFSEGKYVLKEEDAEHITRHIEALRNSGIHKPTHSVYVSLITSFGVTESKHRSHLNDIVTLDSLF